MAGDDAHDGPNPAPGDDLKDDTPKQTRRHWSRSATRAEKDPPSRPEDVPPSWRAQVLARVWELRGRADVARARLASKTPSESKVDTARVDAVLTLLECAEGAARKPRIWRRPLRAWWTGSTIDYAWDSVQRADMGLIDVASEDELRGVVSPLLRWMRQVLPEREAEDWARRLAAWESPRPQRRGPVLGLLRREQRPAQRDRSLLRQAYGDVITANRDWHSSLRAFRNVIFCTALGLALLLIVLSVWHLENNTVVPLCPPTGDRVACFSGSSAGKTVIEVELIGMLGGLLGTGFLLAKLRKPPSRYNVLLPQIVLKAVAGAAAALVGVLFIQSGLLLTAPLENDSTLVLLVYAFTFGFSQQLLTQLVDRQSRTLLAPPERASSG